MMSKKINVIFGISKTKFFNEEINRKMILPNIIESLDQCNENNFPIIFSIFFTTKSRNDIKTTVKYLLKYFKEIIKTNSNNNFGIALLYFSNSSSI